MYVEKCTVSLIAMNYKLIMLPLSAQKSFYHVGEDVQKRQH